MSLKELFDMNKELDLRKEEYLSVRREYDKREFEIITTFDFKAEYGKDNEKIRKGHIKEELKELQDKKDRLSLQIDSLNRYIKFLELKIEYGGE